MQGLELYAVQIQRKRIVSVKGQRAKREKRSGSKPGRAMRNRKQGARRTKVKHGNLFV